MNLSKLILVISAVVASSMGCRFVTAQELLGPGKPAVDMPLEGPTLPSLIGVAAANSGTAREGPEQYEELPVPASEPPAPNQPPPNLGRPRIGVVLGGGGAAGVCHVGVLQVLEEYGIPVDCIAGTSMGSIVAGLYSMGLSGHEIERIVYQFRWDEVLVEPPSHATKYERRKTDDYLFPPVATIGLDHGKANLGGGFVSGQNLTLQLRRMLAAANPIHNFDDLPIPFRTVATDLETGEIVVFRNGNLATAIRSSMSIPGVFPPVRYGERLLIDGGVRNNVPVDLAREMGADILIVVRIPADFKRGDDLKSLFSISSQALTIMSAHGSSHQANGLTDLDILIEPQMNGIGSLDFSRAREAVALGVAATRQCDPQLRQLLEMISADSPADPTAGNGSPNIAPTKNISPSDEPALDRSASPISADEPVSTTPVMIDRPQRIALASPDKIQVDRIQIWNRSDLAPFESIASRLSVRALEPFSLDQLEEDIARIYGTGNFGNVDYELGTNEYGESVLDIFASPDPRGHTLLTVGLGLEENFKGDSFYTASTSVVSRGLNQLGGEIRLVGQLGSRQNLEADFFQPLEPTQRYFVRPYLSYNGFVQPLVLGETTAADYLFRRYATGLELGRTLGDYGVITAGTMLETSNGSLITGMPTLAIPKDYSSLGGFFCGIKHDSLDNYFFPNHGVLAETKYSSYRNWFGSESPADILTARVIAAKSRGSHIGILRVEATIDEIFSGATLLRDSTSGGFLRMSGFARHEIISGRHAITSMIYMHQFKSLMGSRVKAYHGMSAEVGYFDGTTVNIQPRKPIAAGSVFIAMETPLGPLFAGYGLSESGSNSPFVAMGQVF